jgi:hypothetical protein
MVFAAFFAHPAVPVAFAVDLSCFFGFEFFALNLEARKWLEPIF